MWFVKSRRAQSDTDFETWVEGEVSPTLNAFDNTGDSRATVLIIDGTRVDDVRVYDDEITPCLKSRMGTGGNNVPMITQETTHDVIGTIQARSYKGPNHENARDGQLVIQETDMTDVNGSDIAATLRGFGHGWQGQHNSTNAVAQETDMTDAIPIQGTIIGRQDHNGPQGKGFGNNVPMITQGLGAQPSEDAWLTLRKEGSGHAVAYDEYNDALGGDVHHALRAGTRQSTGVVTTMQVRRLTPIECEKLMGWKENHTLPRADGKTNSDTTRYKMCGNGVASPVAEWIGRQIMAVHNERD